MTEELPEGMVPWDGGDEAPEDWDQSDVLLRDGRTCSGEKVTWWGRASFLDLELENCEIIAYTPEDNLL